MSHHHTQHANLTCYVLSFESCSQEKMQHQLSSEVQKKSTELLKTQRQMASMASELRAKNAELEELHTKNTALAMTEMHNKHAREENRRLRVVHELQSRHERRGLRVGRIPMQGATSRRRRRAQSAQQKSVQCSGKHR